MAGAPQLLGAIAADDAIPFLKFLTRKKRRRGDKAPAGAEPSTLFRGDSTLLGLTGLGESTSVDKGDVDKGDGNVSLASEKSADIEFGECPTRPGKLRMSLGRILRIHSVAWHRFPAPLASVGQRQAFPL